MSRVGKQVINLPPKVTVTLDANKVIVIGPRGKLDWTLPQGISLIIDKQSLSLSRSGEGRQVRALHGTSQRLVSNMVIGVSEGFKKELEIHGVGFRAAVKGSFLDLNLGQSHPRNHPIPPGVKVSVAENTKILIEGNSKQEVGQLAADLRNYYPPEPYKGKGVRYVGERIRRKAGKSVK